MKQFTNLTKVYMNKHTISVEEFGFFVAIKNCKNNHPLKSMRYNLAIGKIAEYYNEYLNSEYKSIKTYLNEYVNKTKRPSSKG